MDPSILLWPAGGLEDGDKGGREKRPEGGVSHPQPPRKILGDRKEAEEIFFSLRIDLSTLRVSAFPETD